MNRKMKKNLKKTLLPLAGMALALCALCALAQLLPESRGESAALQNGVVVSEVMSKNTHVLLDDFGGYSDWIELRNESASPVDLSGWMVMSESAADAFVFSRESLQPGETLLIFASGRSQTRSGYVYHAPFRLSASGDAVSLYDASGGLAFSVEVPPLEADVSWARGAEGGFATCPDPTPGEPNGAIQPAAVAVQTAAEGNVRLNEIMASNATYRFEDGCLCDYIELYNDRALPQPLDGYALTDDESNPKKYPLDGLAIPAYSCLVIHLDGEGSRAGHAAFSLSGKGEQVLLYDPQDRLADSLRYEPLEGDQALSFADGGWTTLLAPTPGLPNTTDNAVYIASQFEAALHSSLLINEVCYSNTARVDGLNSFDWLELRNTGSQPVDLTGYGLSDDPSKPRKWQFPSGASITAGGYLVVMLADGDTAAPDARGYYRTGFALSAGESVTLCTPEGAVIDRLPVMKQYGDISCGRLEGQSGFFYFEKPTIGAYNGASGARSRCQKPTFSVAGGLYGAGQTLTVEISAEPDALIFYTTDCSEPTTASSIYSGPITVSQNAIIRAIATRRGSIDSYVATESYFFGLGHNLRVVSLVSAPDNLFSGKTGIIANQLEKWERAANVEIYAADGSVVQPSHGCGIALNGDASRRLEMKSFRVLGRSCYDETNSFTGGLFTDRNYPSYRSFLLRGGGQDNTRALIRDPFIDSLAGDTEVMYQESEMCVLYINGEYYGVYDIRERISTYSICDFEGWERTKRMDIVKGDTLAQYGTNTDFEDILSWIAAHPASTDENIAYLETRIDLDNYLDFMCLMVYSANQDIGVRRYRSVTTDGKWRWIAYDQDFGFYNDTDSITRWLDPKGAGTRKNIDTTLFRYVMANDAARDRYLTRFGELLAGPWAPDELLSRFDALVETIRPEMARHGQRWPDTLPLKRWEQQIASMRQRIEERAGKIIGYITDCFKLNDADRTRYFGAALERIGRS